MHTDPDLIPDNLVWSAAELPEDPEIPERIWDIANVENTRTLGKAWIDNKSSLALRVPSVIVPDTPADFNVLLNPTHDAYSEIVWRRGGGFVFDSRLFQNDASVY